MSLEADTPCDVWFLFDAEQVHGTRLRREIRSLLQSKRIHLPSCVSAAGGRVLLVEFNGGLRVVESCRDAVSEMARSKALSCLLVRDGASEKVREKLHPLLSAMEQELRRFISMALIDALGFGTARSCMLRTVLSLTPDEKLRKLAVSSPQPLEVLDFRGLLRLVDSPVPGPTGDDCREFLGASTTIEEAAHRLDERLGFKTYWKSVFSRYFPTPGEWRRTKQVLHNVADARNQVMHFRVFKSTDMDKISRLSRAVIDLLRTRKPELTKAKKRRDERLMRNLSRRIDRILAGLEGTLAEVAQEASKALTKPDRRV